jgi:hypothetical protein
MIKEEPILISHDLKFYVSMAKSSFINLCDSSNEDDLSLPNVFVPISMNYQLLEDKPLHLDVL